MEEKRDYKELIIELFAESMDTLEEREKEYLYKLNYEYIKGEPPH